MCGIIGYIGKEQALPVIVNGLRRMEYRGYDSAGAAIIVDGCLQIQKTVEKLDVLEANMPAQRWQGSVGIGHSRWATHGRPTLENCHPHVDCNHNFAVVHNGIIDNFSALKAELEERGHHFSSETDSEVIPHLIEEYYTGDLEQAFTAALQRLQGAFALAVISDLHPDMVLAYSQHSSMVVGLGSDANYIASDIPALLPYTRNMYLLADGELAILTPDKVEVKVNGHLVDKEVQHIDWDPVVAEKGGYEHFMLKEIHEQPQALRDTYSGRLGSHQDEWLVHLPQLGLTPQKARSLRQLHIVACGTSYHAGMVGKYIIERLARIQVNVDIASEFCYRDPLLEQEALVLVISQSGETADTLAALREAKQRGCTVWAITNVLGSSVDRESDAVISTGAGPEIALASTKAYTSQLVVLTLLAIHLSELRGTAPKAELEVLAQELRNLPELVQTVLAKPEPVQDLAQHIADYENVFFTGRGLDYAGSLEAALKLKETSYIHAEAFAAGELKHGPLALITSDIPVVCLLTQPALRDKMESNIAVVLARGAKTLVVDTTGDPQLERLGTWRLPLPKVHELLAPILSIVPLQLLAYYVALARGCDVDNPRNLAKSVTIE